MTAKQEIYNGVKSFVSAWQSEDLTTQCNRDIFYIEEAMKHVDSFDHVTTIILHNKNKLYMFGCARQAQFITDYLCEMHENNIAREYIPDMTAIEASLLSVHAVALDMHAKLEAKLATFR